MGGGLHILTPARRQFLEIVRMKEKMFGNSSILIAAADETAPGNKCGILTICVPGNSSLSYQPPISIQIYGSGQLKELHEAIRYALDIPSASESSE